MEKALGIAKSVTSHVPLGEPDRLVRGPRRRAGIPRAEADRDVLLFPDVYTTYTNPGAGRPRCACWRPRTATSESPMWTGRAPPHSKGMLDESRAAARDAVETLVPDVADGWDVVVVEPTDAVMLQTDYHDLLDGDASDVPTPTWRPSRRTPTASWSTSTPTGSTRISTSTRPPNRSRITGTATRRRRRRTITRSACSDVRGTGSIRSTPPAVGWRARSATRPSTTR